MMRKIPALLVAFALAAPATALAQTVIEETSYTVGDPAAPLTVVEFLDFGCESCAEFANGTMPLVRERYIATGEVQWRAVPFVMGSFPNSTEAARAAYCAHQQDAFWPFHDVLFADRDTWMGARDPLEQLTAYARSLELDSEAFLACYDDRDTKRRVDRQNRAARRFRVRATPTFLVDGHPVLGALSFEQFSSVLDARLAEGGS